MAEPVRSRRLPEQKARADSRRPIPRAMLVATVCAAVWYLVSTVAATEAAQNYEDHTVDGVGNRGEIGRPFTRRPAGNPHRPQRLRAQHAGQGARQRHGCRDRHDRRIRRRHHPRSARLRARWTATSSQPSIGPASQQSPEI